MSPDGGIAIIDLALDFSFTYSWGQVLLLHGIPEVKSQGVLYITYISQNSFVTTQILELSKSSYTLYIGHIVLDISLPLSTPSVLQLCRSVGHLSKFEYLGAGLPTLRLPRHDRHFRINLLHWPQVRLQT